MTILDATILRLREIARARAAEVLADPSDEQRRRRYRAAADRVLRVVAARSVRGLL